jgi:exonuclease III
VPQRPPAGPKEAAVIHYWPLKKMDKSTRKRTVEGLERTRKLVAELMPGRTLQSTLVLGTWNLRNFDDNRFRDGPRMQESLFYIAEVISAFDVIAIQEICRDLTPFKKVMRLLGPAYDYIVTDVTEGPSGNRERLGFVYNTNKVRFRKVAGEIVLPWKDQISDTTKQRQFARTPFACAFQSGWFRFIFSTVHIYYGKKSQTSKEYKRRVKEIEAVAKFLVKLAKKEEDNYILVGDFNIDHLGDPTGNALVDQGFKTTQNILGSNSTKNKFYDQISWLPRQGAVRQAQSDKNSGVLDVLSAVLRDGDTDFEAYDPEVIATLNRKLARAEGKVRTAEAALDRARSKNKPLDEKQADLDKAREDVAEFKRLLADKAARKEYYTDTWRTYQISDHLPLWVELEVDFSAEYLDGLKG